VMTAAIYDQTGTEFVKIKRGVLPRPEAMAGKTMGDIKAEDEALAECKKQMAAKK
jgi:pyruvate carboxylase subunit B